MFRIERYCRQRLLHQDHVIILFFHVIRYLIFHVFYIKPFYPMNKIQAEIVSFDFLVYDVYLVNYYKRSSKNLF